MHSCPGNWVAIWHAVDGVITGLPTNLVQELNVGTVTSRLKISKKK